MSETLIWRAPWEDNRATIDLTAMIVGVRKYARDAGSRLSHGDSTPNYPRITGANFGMVAGALGINPTGDDPSLGDDLRFAVARLRPVLWIPLRHDERWDRPAQIAALEKLWEEEGFPNSPGYYRLYFRRTWEARGSLQLVSGAPMVYALASGCNPWGSAGRAFSPVRTTFIVRKEVEVGQ